MPCASVRLSAADDPRKRWSSAVAPTSGRRPAATAEPPEAAQKVGSLGSRATKAARLPFMRQYGSGGTSPLPGALAPAVDPSHGFLPRSEKTRKGYTRFAAPIRAPLRVFPLRGVRAPHAVAPSPDGGQRTPPAGGVGGCPLLVLRSSGFVRRSFLPFFLGLCPLAAGFGVLLPAFFSCFAASVAGAFSFVSSCRFAALRDDGARPPPRGKAARQRPRAAATNQLRARFASRLPIVTRSSSPRRAAVPAGLDKRVIMIVRRRDASRLPLDAECRGSGGSLFFARSSRKKCLH